MYMSDVSELVESKRNPIDNGFRELVRIYFK